MTIIPPPPPPPPIVNLDFETYSEAGFVATPTGWAALPGAKQGKKGLEVVGSKVYVEHPTFEVLTLSYDLNDGRGVRRWRPGLPPPVDLFDHVHRGGFVSGWNSGGFEVKVWQWLVENQAWPAVPPRQWRDEMANARAHNLPGKLEKAAEVLNCVQQKDKGGRSLLDKFSIPRKPTKKDQRRRIRPEDEPEEAERLYEYCDQDVRTEQSVGEHIPRLSPGELAVWQCDRAINDRGVQIDVAAVDACIDIINQAHDQYNTELYALTGGAVSKASELQKLTEWLNAHGVYTPSLDEDHLTGLLKRPTLPAPARRALEIRAAIGSASVKKVFAMRNQVSRAGRLHDLFTYHGARTGRTTGNGPQPTNLPNSGGVVVFECEQCGRHYGLHASACPWCCTSATLAHSVDWGVRSAEYALETIMTRSLSYVEYVWGDAMAAISGSLRSLFMAAVGNDLICSDYSAIEAVVLAELAGEAWRQEVFRTHGKIYEMSASMMTGVPLEEILAHKKETGQHHPLRERGKVNELACGYGGWIGSMKAFGADDFMTEEEMRTAVIGWRDASPAVVEFWGGQPSWKRQEYFGVEGMFVQAILNPGQVFEFRGLRFQSRGDAVFLRLLSGREIAYHRPRLAPSERRRGEYSISFEGWNTNPKNGPVGWIRMDTYGPRLTENIVQATSRDIQWHGILALEAAGYPIVLHVYDEDVAEVPEGFGSVEEFERIMATLPAWAEGWPIKAAGGWRGKRYRK